MRKTTDQLREGDVVLHYGMRILIDGPAHTYPDRGHTVYRWPGLVLNADELCDPASPSYSGYIASHLRGTRWRDIVPRRRMDDWPVQGNGMALWNTEPEENS